MRGRWRNIGIPNPKKDLTCRCRKPALQFNGDPPIRNDCNNRNEVRTSKKRPHSPVRHFLTSVFLVRLEQDFLHVQNVSASSELLHTAYRATQSLPALIAKSAKK